MGEKNFDVFLADFALPEVFFFDYMTALSEEALKLYLLFSLHRKHNPAVRFEDTAKQLAYPPETLRQAEYELVTHGLLRRAGERQQFEIVDLKMVEVERYAEAYAREQTTSAKSLLPENEARLAQLLNDLSCSFLNGNMSYRWYQIVSRCVDQYLFTHELVYMLFSEAERLGKVYPSYVQKMAEDWAEAGLRTGQDLDRYTEKRRRLRDLCQRVGRLLRSHLTQPQEDRVRSWVEKLGFDEDVICKAIEVGSQRPNAGLAYYEKILEQWKKEELRTLREVESYLQEKERSRDERPPLMAEIETLMKLRLNSQQEKEILRWKHEYRSEDDLILRAVEEGLKDSLRPSMKYFAKILEAWAAQGLHSVSDLETAQRKHGLLSAESGTRSGKRSFGARESGQNFVGRRYQTEDYRRLEARGDALPSFKKKEKDKHSTE